MYEVTHLTSALFPVVIGWCLRTLRVFLMKCVALIERLAGLEAVEGTELRFS